MNIGERIKQARELRRITQTELADAIGTTKQNVYKYENGIVTNIPSDKIEAISKFLGTSPAYLMGWEGDEKDVTTSVSLRDAIPFTPDSMIAFPILGKVSAGMGSYAEPDNIVGTMVTDADKIIDGYDYVWLRVEGDSMEPELLDGDHVLVRVQDTAETGDLVVVLVDDENGVIKRIEYEVQNHITLISNNPRYTPRVFVREEMNRIRIFGKVVKMSRSF